MKVTIHQPEFMPYVGLIQKIDSADTFVILNDTQFEKNNYQNRNKLLASGKENWISVPIVLESHTMNINEIHIRYPQWNQVRKKLARQLSQEYGKSEYFSDVVDYVLEPVLGNYEYDKLEDLNCTIILRILDYLGINTKIVYSSDLNEPGHSTEHLVNICKRLGADEYISGQGGKKYMDESLFEKNNIKVTYFEPNIIPYPQMRTKRFIPYLSVLDGLFNHGKSFIKYIDYENTI